MDLYFARHDGQAVTCDDFWQAMYDGNEGHPGLSDLNALKVWYSQAGTPEVTVTPTYDAASKTLTLKAVQRTPPTAGQSEKKPVLVPIAVGLVGPSGSDLPLTLADSNPQLAPGTTTAVLRMTSAEQSWTFTDVPAGAVPSILRNFSAPVRLAIVGQSDADLAFLFKNDSDPFNRWEAGQRLGRNALLSLYDVALKAVTGIDDSHAAVHAAVVQTMDAAAGSSVSSLSTAFSALLADATLDGAFVARAISLPAETEIIDALAASASHGHADPVVVHEVREYLVRALASSLRTQLEGVIKRVDAEIAAAEGVSGGYSPDFASVARRALRNKSLVYLAALAEPSILAGIAARFNTASNMTDSVATLIALIDQPADCKERVAALDAFYQTWKDEPLVLLKWLGLQAGSCDPGNTATVKALMSHPSFAITNPNACYSLFGAYSANSVPAFHSSDGSGYAFLTDVVRQLDAVNPQVAARIVSAFARYRSYDTKRQALMRDQLQSLAAGKLSENVGEIVTRSLAA